MLLNQIPVLDKGYVALIDSCNTTKKLRDIGQEYFHGEYPVELEYIGFMTVSMKCPLFIQLNLSKFNLKIINVSEAGSTEAFIPNAAQVGQVEAELREAIVDDIARTTEALLINPSSYQADGADRFVSQILTPVSVYTTLIVSGAYKDWCAFAYNQKKAPGPILAYTMAVQQIIEAEWK